MRGDHLINELEWFNKHRHELLAEHRGKWAVVHKQQLIGVYDDFSSAYGGGTAATDSYELLVKQILEKEEPIEISVNITHGLLYGFRST